MGIDRVSGDPQLASGQGDIGIALPENTIDFAAFGFFYGIAKASWTNGLFDIIDTEKPFNVFFSNHAFRALNCQNA